MIVYKVDAVDGISVCPAHSSIGDANAACAHEPSDLVHGPDATVTVDVVFFGQMIGDWAETDLVTLSEHAATLVVRDKMSDMQMIWEGTLDIDEEFIVIAARLFSISFHSSAKVCLIFDSPGTAIIKSPRAHTARCWAFRSPRKCSIIVVHI